MKAFCKVKLPNIKKNKLDIQISKVTDMLSYIHPYDTNRNE